MDAIRLVGWICYYAHGWSTLAWSTGHKASKGGGGSAYRSSIRISQLEMLHNWSLIFSKISVTIYSLTFFSCISRSCWSSSLIRALTMARGCLPRDLVIDFVSVRAPFLTTSVNTPKWWVALRNRQSDVEFHYCNNAVLEFDVLHEFTLPLHAALSSLVRMQALFIAIGLLQIVTRHH